MNEQEASRENSAWKLVTEFFSTLIENSEDFTVFQVCSGRVDTSEPYVQTLREEDGKLRLECISNEYLEPPMTRESELQLQEMGWLPPMKEEDFTNFYLYFDLDEVSYRSTAEFLIATLREVFSLQLTDSITCDASDEALTAINRKFRFDPRQCFSLHGQFYR